jgi:ABC-type phosphate transport system substrate-binding protein
MNKKTMIIGGVGVAAAIVAILIFKKPAQASTTGTIIINTIPAGASVSVDGSSTGVSPLNVDIAPGTHAILIELADYNDVATSVSVVAGSTHTLNVSLTPVGTNWTPIDIVWS